MSTEESDLEASAFFAVRSGGKSRVVDVPLGHHVLLGPPPALLVASDALAHAEIEWDGARVLLRAREGDPELVYVAGRRVESEVELRPGDEVAIGDLHLVLGIASPSMSTARRALLHGEFGERLAEELARAARGGRPVSLAFVRTRPGDGGRLLRAALARFRAGDVVATYAPDEVELLLPDTPRERAELVVSRLIESAALTDARAGIVVAPLDAAHPEPLVRAARVALRVATGEPERLEVEAPIVVDASTTRAVQDLEAAWTSRVLHVRGELGTGKATLVSLVHRSRSAGEPLAVISCARVRDVDDIIEAAVDAPLGTLLVRDLDAWPSSDRPALVSRLLRSGLPARRVVFTENTPAAQTPDPRARPLVDDAREISLAPLRRRADDIVPLAERFVRHWRGSPLHLSPGALARLRSHPWPGNVLELENAIERAVSLATSGEILAEHLPGDPVRAPTEGRLREHVDSLERDAITKALAEANHNQTRAARLLGLSRRALIYKMEKYGLKGPAGTLRKR